MYQKGRLFTYPTMLNLTGKKCVIIGGGSVAERKLHSLLQAGASVTVIAPQFTTGIEEATRQTHCTLIAKTYQPQQLDNAFLVIAATDSKVINREVTRQAPFLCNNVTEPELGNFTVPASLVKENITLTIATGGMPAYTRLLKKYLDNKLTPAMVEFNDFLQEIRQEVQKLPSTPATRTSFWRQALTEEIINLLEENNYTAAKEKIIHAVNCFRSQSQNRSR